MTSTRQLQKAARHKTSKVNFTAFISVKKPLFSKSEELSQVAYGEVHSLQEVDIEHPFWKGCFRIRYGNQKGTNH